MTKVVVDSLVNQVFLHDHPVNTVSSDPVSGILGQQIYNITDGTLKIWNGSGWQIIGGGTGSAILPYVSPLPVSSTNGTMVYEPNDNAIYMYDNGFWALVSALPYALVAENDDFLMTEDDNNLVV